MSKSFLLICAALVAVALIVWPDSNSQYSTEEYWISSSLDKVAQVPASALEPGSRHGPVIMWAAAVSDNPQIITALVAAGADANESDVTFDGTALGAAASQNPSVEIIAVLVRHGADINKVLHWGNTAIHNAAISNPNPEIITALIENGADINARNIAGETALDIAKRKERKDFEEILTIHMAEL